MIIITERLKSARDLVSIKSAIKKMKNGKFDNNKLSSLSKAVKKKFNFKNVAIFNISTSEYPVLQLYFSKPMIDELKMSIMNNDYELRTINNNLLLAVNDMLFDNFTSNEILAGMIHEIGHIINIDNYKDMFRRQLLTSNNVTTPEKIEIDADSLAIYYGLGKELMSFLTKIEEYSGVTVSYRKKNILDMVNLHIGTAR